MQKLKSKKYNSQVSWVVFFASLILLGLFLGIVFDLGTVPRMVIGLILFCIWFWVDWTMRKKYPVDEG